MTMHIGVITDGDSDKATHVVVSTQGLNVVKAAVEEKMGEGDAYEWVDRGYDWLYFPVNDSGGYFSTAAIYTTEDGKITNL